MLFCSFAKTCVLKRASSFTSSFTSSCTYSFTCAPTSIKAIGLGDYVPHWSLVVARHSFTNLTYLLKSYSLTPACHSKQAFKHMRLCAYAPSCSMTWLHKYQEVRVLWGLMKWASLKRLGWAAPCQLKQQLKYKTSSLLAPKLAHKYDPAQEFFAFVFVHVF